MRILLIEDEAGLRGQIAELLRGRNYAVDAIGLGEEGCYLGSEIDFDLAIVDLGLPDLGGLSVIQRWRQAGRRFPVLILTARGHWREKVEGLEAGADDYLVKPFHVEELVARAQALIRRASGLPSSRLVAGPIVLDTRAQQVLLQNKPLALTAYEYRTLEYLMRHAGETVSKARLGEHLYEDHIERDSNVLEQYVARLRQKLDPDKTLRPLTTLRGQGYRFELAVASE